MDEETGLYYYGARYYNPRESVFLSVDPMFEQTGTPYQYAYQNPIKYIDPTGMLPEDGGGDPPKRSWFGRNISQPIGDFFRGIFRGNTDKGTSTNGKRGTIEVEEPIGEICRNDIDCNISENASVVAGALTIGETASGGAGGITAIRSALARLSPWLAMLSLNGDVSRSIVDDYTITQDPDGADIYLYRNMTSTGGLPTLGEGANKLGIRSKDVEGKTGADYVYPSSLQGLSTTMGVGSVIPQVPFANPPKTTLFRISVKSLPAHSLLPVLINGNYSRIIPAYRMSVQEFDMRIKSTAPLWKPVR